MTITIYDEHDQPITVSVDYSMARRGERNRYGVAMTPDDPVQIHIIDAIGPDGLERDLSHDEICSVREAVFEAVDQAD